MTEQELKIILGQNIKKFRSHHRLSQADFAEHIDISIPFLSDIENGKKWVSPATLTKMASALNIEVYELFRPETVIPDNLVAILEKYSDDIYQGFGITLTAIQKKYLQQLNTKIKKEKK